MAKLLTVIVIVNAVFSSIEASPFVGKVNLAEGMLLLEGISPTGAGLQEPVVICLVMGRLGTVKQKLMKLFDDVREAT